MFPPSLSLGIKPRLLHWAEEALPDLVSAFPTSPPGHSAPAPPAVLPGGGSCQSLSSVCFCDGLSARAALPSHPCVTDWLCHLDLTGELLEGETTSAWCRAVSVPAEDIECGGGGGGAGGQ